MPTLSPTNRANTHAKLRRFAATLARNSVLGRWSFRGVCTEWKPHQSTYVPIKASNKFTNLGPMTLIRRIHKDEIGIVNCRIVRVSRLVKDMSLRKLFLGRCLVLTPFPTAIIQSVSRVDCTPL